MKKEVFIEKALAVHGDTYDYSLLPDEFSTKDKVPVVCRDHGVFYQKVSNHLHLKQLCPICGDNKALESKRINGQERFLRKAKDRFGDRFNYSRVSYVRENLPVSIICSIHGEFEQTPSDHLSSKCGCTACGMLHKREILADTAEIFISKAINIHGHCYDYSKVEYVNAHTKVEIVCALHGSFYQKPNTHLCGSGCSRCGDARGGRWSLKTLDKNLEYFKNTRCFLYLMEIKTDTFSCYKVGISETPHHRRNTIHRELATCEVNLLNIVCSDVYSCLSLELDIKKKLKHYAFVTPYSFAGHTECYKYSEDVKLAILEWFG